MDAGTGWAGMEKMQTRLEVSKTSSMCSHHGTIYHPIYTNQKCFLLQVSKWLLSLIRLIKSLVVTRAVALEEQVPAQLWGARVLARHCTDSVVG